MLRVFVAAMLLALSMSAAQAGTVMIFAAASLRGALDDVARAYERQAPETRISISYAGSASLARQIEAGAPADIFFPADTDWMDFAATKLLIRPATRRNLLSNRLVLVAPVSSSLRPVSLDKSTPLKEMLRTGRLGIGAPATVPAGKYAKAALINLGLWEQASGQLAEAESVRAVLAYVARGEVPLGVVYETDARAEPKVKVVGQFPWESHPAILYPSAITTYSRNPEAVAVQAFLNGQVAQAIFEKHGFTQP